MMITEALEQCMEVWRVSHSLSMCVISHGYGGFGGIEMVVVDGMHT